MNLLAFDTSTETLSAAILRDGALAVEERGTAGAQASATLIPALLELLARARLKLADLDAIVFGRGPGSFTGLRTACAVAQGLGFASGVPVLGVETLLAVAEEARERAYAMRVVAMLDARMGEVYAARYSFDRDGWHRQGKIALAPVQGIEIPEGWTVAGNIRAVYGDALPAGAVDVFPSAAAMLRIAPRLIAAGAAVDAADAAPVYIRDKVAQTTEERALARSARPTAP